MPSASLPPPTDSLELASALFGDSLPLATRFGGWLAGAGVERGLVGPHEPGRLWSRHLLNCAALAPLPPQGASVVDIGSGAGLPGIVLAILRSDLRLVLIESMQRRVTFLREVLDDLGLTAVTVVHGRAESASTAAAVGRADVATARAVAPIDRLAAWAAPLLRPGGSLFALKGASAPREFAEFAVTVQKAGFAPGARILAAYPALAGHEPEAGADRGVYLRCEMEWRLGAWVDRPDSTETPATQSNDLDAPPLATILHIIRAGGSRRRQGLV